MVSHKYKRFRILLKTSQVYGEILMRNLTTHHLPAQHVQQLCPLKLQLYSTHFSYILHIHIVMYVGTRV